MATRRGMAMRPGAAGPTRRGGGGIFGNVQTTRSRGGARFKPAARGRKGKAGGGGGGG
jgi:hypothetical protein